MTLLSDHSEQSPGFCKHLGPPNNNFKRTRNHAVQARWRCLKAGQPRASMPLRLSVGLHNIQSPSFCAKLAGSLARLQRR